MDDEYDEDYKQITDMFIYDEENNIQGVKNPEAFMKYLQFNDGLKSENEEYQFPVLL